MKKFNNFYKRLLAYAFDFLLIQLFVSILVDSSVINFQYNDYSKTYKEYEELYEEYYKYKDIDIKDCTDLTKQINDKKIKVDDIITAYSEISDEEECNILVNNINSKKINEEELNKKSGKLYYKIQRLSTFKYIVIIIVTYLYLVLFQGYTKGKTLGKKLMRVRVVSNNKKSVSYKQLAIRTVFLGNVIYYLFSSILPWIINQEVFIRIGNGLYLMNTLFYVVMIIFAYSNKDMVGIHDIIAKTKVLIEERK